MKFILRIVRPIATGLLAVLPIIITFALIGWIASYIAAYLGPGSSFGRGVAKLGAFVVDDNLAYAIGVALVCAALYMIGLLVQSRLRRLWSQFFEETLGRVPLVGTIYKTLVRFVQLLERRDDVDVQSMSPVWCFFSDERRTAILGLMPTSETITIEGSLYHVVMVPTAPVPFGGGLFFLPAEWVRAADFGVEGLTNIYVSMGVTAPDYMGKIRKAQSETPTMVTRSGEAKTPPDSAADAIAPVPKGKVGPASLPPETPTNSPRPPKAPPKS
ncbi:DUF502 domain-containing protein [Acuticoccus sp. MNP-M23]|uniref:DUF502 domain-containing protein n=1 Tax=Acuticoccus sp. MNP-M23 TaxID=3072793 RepID=UPI0028159325|nr:DUF502 domain-containing protein [Acuticoccus sp. MNP-M23]WMS42017.1 DUF502 domain-containing protein [Acuticoccus sp. MNP-M23]